ncbi:hypothetical protein PR048_006400 [Dryococelus australis]|uniref:Reverse transcriptase domain-containing protein n=1 Tax=Dryococelus australis TaxID=614101 RepID=A0ABQ9IC32_9NEOP|nr:hypothetical protein PR048_006400 [Dryococelus australis]
MTTFFQLTKAISEALDKGDHAYGIFWGLSKALDLVNNSILLQKLSNLGISELALNLLKSYLCNRTQIIEISNENNKVTSEWETIKTGVPQGSILGPLLFLVSINDLWKHIKYGNLTLFPDDTSILVNESNLEILSLVAEKILMILEKWFQINRLVLNVDKSQFIQFSKNHRHNEQILFTHSSSTIDESAVRTGGTHVLLGGCGRCHCLRQGLFDTPAASSALLDLSSSWMWLGGWALKVDTKLILGGTSLVLLVVGRLGLPVQGAPPQQFGPTGDQAAMLDGHLPDKVRRGLGQCLTDIALQGPGLSSLVEVCLIPGWCRWRGASSISPSFHPLCLPLLALPQGSGFWSGKGASAVGLLCGFILWPLCPVYIILASHNHVGSFLFVCEPSAELFCSLAECELRSSMTMPIQKLLTPVLGCGYFVLQRLCGNLFSLPVTWVAESSSKNELAGAGVNYLVGTPPEGEENIRQVLVPVVVVFSHTETKTLHELLISLLNGISLWVVRGVVHILLSLAMHPQAVMSPSSSEDGYLHDCRHLSGQLWCITTTPLEGSTASWSITASMSTQEGKDEFLPPHQADKGSRHPCVTSELPTPLKRSQLPSSPFLDPTSSVFSVNRACRQTLGAVFCTFSTARPEGVSSS